MTILEFLQAYQVLVLAGIAAITLLGLVSLFLSHQRRMALIRLGLLKPHKQKEWGKGFGDRLGEGLFLIGLGVLFWLVFQYNWTWTMGLFGLLVVLGCVQIVKGIFGGRRTI